MSKGKKFIELWDTVELNLTGILSLFALCAAFYQVITRYFLNWAPEWAEESVLYLIIWAVFIIGSKLVREDHHVGADFLIQKLPFRIKRKVAIITSILALLFCLIVVFYGVQIVSMALQSDERSPTRMRFPMWIAYLSVPVGCFLMAISYTYRIYNLLKERKISEDELTDRRTKIT